jgi:serine/threonine protein kinase/Tfp pilus assembly protein PilF
MKGMSPGLLAGPAVCSTCDGPLSGRGACFACLLRVGLEPGSEEELPASAIFGDFEIARLEDGSWWELGRGAMGVTYRAIDRVLHRSVALKVIDVGPGAVDARAVRERFLREARTAAALRHKNVAGIFQFGASSEAGRCYYAMELVEGETLEARVRRDGPLPVAAVLEIAVQVTAALMAAAPQGLIHRDLKPGNLMLSSGDNDAAPELEVKVIDFGLAKAVSAVESGATPAGSAGAGTLNLGETNLTQGGFIGTPAFASPEQLERRAVDARSDIYSLGVTLWYALTGVVPFRANTLDELRQHPARETLPVEQLAARRVPAPVVELLRGMLAADPAGRPASARALMAKLEACRQRCGIAGSGGKPLAAERNRVATRSLAGLLLALAALAAAAWWDLARPQTKQPGAGQSLIPPKSIAVLPFENLSPHKDDAFFIDGVQEEILTDLAKAADLKVISRSSVLQYQSSAPRNLPGIAAQLGVAYLVEGSIQRAGNQVRVNARLIDVRTNTDQWAMHYDRPLDDVFAIQSEIAQAIAGELQVKLSAGEKNAIETAPTNNIAAYDAYLQGKKLGRDADHRGEEGEMRQAVRLLEEATDRDPRFFLAWCELSMANVNLYWWDCDRTPERLARAETALRAAQALRPDAGETHLAEAMFRYWSQRDYAGSIPDLEAAARLLPNDAEVADSLGFALVRDGRWEDSIRQYQRATELDPLNTRAWHMLQSTEQYAQHYTAAAHALDHLLALDPKNRDYALTKAMDARSVRADLEPVRQWLRTVPAESERWRDKAALLSVETALDGCDYPAAAAAYARYHPQTKDADTLIYREFLGALIPFLLGDEPAARSAFLAARSHAVEVLQEHPQDVEVIATLAAIEASLGDKENALRHAQELCTLRPISADAVAGPLCIRILAMTYAKTGDRDRAMDALRSIVSKPMGPTYGDLRLERGWDPLRGDPRFEAMVASLAPK